MAGRYGAIDYPTVTKRAFAVGIGLFLLGTLGEYLIHATGMQVPAWELALLVDLEFLGVAVALFSPFVFGILLPLTE